MLQAGRITPNAEPEIPEENTGRSGHSTPDSASYLNVGVKCPDLAVQKTVRFFSLCVRRLVQYCMQDQSSY